MHTKDWLMSHVNEYVEDGQYAIYSTKMLENGELSYTLIGANDVIKVVTQGATDSEMLGSKVSIVLRAPFETNDKSLVIADKVSALDVEFRKVIIRASNGTVSVEINDTIPMVKVMDNWIAKLLEQWIGEIFWGYIWEYRWQKYDDFKYTWIILGDDIRREQEYLYEMCARIANDHDVAIDFIDKSMVWDVLGHAKAEKLWHASGEESFNYRIFEKMRENRQSVIIQASKEASEDM